MSFDVSRRDKHGFLCGRFRQSGLSWPIDVRDDIRPFVFPCRSCNRLHFHLAAEQHAGLGIGLPFAGKPLVSTHRTCYAMCNECTTLNSELTDEMALKLSKGVLPSQICNLLMSVCNPDFPSPYSEEFIANWSTRPPEARLDLRVATELVLRWYAREVDAASMTQSYCRKCRIRVVPKAVLKGFWERLLGSEDRFDYVCEQCNSNVWKPPAA